MDHAMATATWIPPANNRYGIGIRSPGFEKLEARLLAIGGTEVMAQLDPQLDILLERGRVFSGKGRKKIKGVEHCCPQNAALYYAAHHSTDHGGTCQIVPGYQLSGGHWSQHCWIWDGRRILDEFDHTCETYFGVSLTPEESVVFVFFNVLNRLPGFATITGKKTSEEA
jgi:hypothetical protein